MLQEIQQLIDPWANVLDEVESSLQNLSQAALTIGTQLGDLGLQTGKLLGDLCPDDTTCAQNSLVEFKLQGKSSYEI
jgi:hypothetical protein